MQLKFIIYSLHIYWFIIFIVLTHIDLSLLVLFFISQLLYIISHIYLYVINAHIYINNILPRIHNLYRNIQLGFDVSIPVCIEIHYKHGKYVITIWRRKDHIKWFFCLFSLFESDIQFAAILIAWFTFTTVSINWTKVTLLLIMLRNSGITFIY